MCFLNTATQLHRRGSIQAHPQGGGHPQIHPPACSHRKQGKEKGEARHIRRQLSLSSLRHLVGEPIPLETLGATIRHSCPALSPTCLRKDPKSRLQTHTETFSKKWATYSLQRPLFHKQSPMAHKTDMQRNLTTASRKHEFIFHETAHSPYWNLH